MKRVAIGLLVAIALLAGGFAAGWHAKSVRVLASQAKEARAEVTDVVQQHAEQGAKQHEQLKAEQTKSVALATDQSAIRIAATTTKQEIHRASFDPSAVPSPDRATCPDPVGSVDFMRLYNQAARGTPAAAAGAGAR